MATSKNYIYIYISTYIPNSAHSQKRGSLKIPLDSKKLNENVLKNKYQMPNIDELVDQLAQVLTFEKPGRIWYSTIDLLYAYGQLLLSKETTRQGNFSIIGGQATGAYPFQTGFYFLADMPAEFEQAMDRTLENLDVVFAFIDDVLIVTKGTEKEHMEKVKKVLERMQKAGMALKLRTQNEIEWLGYRISQTGIIPLESRLENIQKQTAPKTLRQLRSLTGVAHQLNKHIKDLAQIFHPFRNTLKKEKIFQRKTEHEKAFQKLKQKIQKK